MGSSAKSTIAPALLFSMVAFSGMTSAQSVAGAKPVGLSIEFEHGDAGEVALDIRNITLTLNNQSSEELGFYTDRGISFEFHDEAGVHLAGPHPVSRRSWIGSP